jgi:choline dehydrogenase-like flavoprotein
MFSHHKFVSFVKQFSDVMAYSRGSAEDYDRFAAVTGDPGWSWNRLLPYFFKVRPSSALTAEFLTLRRTKNGPSQPIITIHGAN